MDCPLGLLHLSHNTQALVHDMAIDRTQFDLFDQTFRYYGYQSVYTELAMSMGSHLRAWVRVNLKAPEAVAATLKEPPQVHPQAGGYT